MATHPGSYVKQHILPTGLSVTKAAEMMDVGRPALSNFLNGKSALSSTMATRLEKAFGANKGELLNLQQQYTSEQNKETEKKIAVKTYTPSFLQISATDLEAWADKLEARSTLPALIRRLVNTTGEGITNSDFPAFDNAQRHGWDGKVESENTTPWIPQGFSGWEFGCNQNPQNKANGDYAARTNSINGPERKNTSFVFITPRNWPQKDRWAKEKNDANQWLNVYAYDASDLEQWLEHSVSTQVWLAEYLGIPTNDCESLDQYWSSWSQTTTPPISEKIFDGALTDNKKQLVDWYRSGSPQALILAAASNEEAKAFLSSAAKNCDELATLQDRAVFISSVNTARRLAEISSSYIPVVDNDDIQRSIVDLFQNRPSIIVCERNVKGVEPDIRLDLPNAQCFKEALSDMGFDEAETDVLANQSGHSPTILRRQLATLPALKKPPWAANEDKLLSMIPLVLAGAWCTEKDADQEIIACLADTEYPAVERQITLLATMDDPPIWCEGNYCGVVSRLDCLYAIADHITQQDIDNFFLVAELVLAEDDPALDLVKDQRWAANIYDKVRDHSPAIRNSLCQNLIILAIHGNGLFGARLAENIETRVNCLISDLLKDKTPREWQASQSDLPRYAEAAPNTFLSIVEEEIQKDEPAFKVLFEPVGSAMFDRCERVGMLWALELLAWNPTFLSRVVLIFGKLSTYPLEDNHGNKPINSLKDILLSWRPHTAAPVEQRCQVLELLCQRHPDIGWNLCVKSLSPGSDTTSGTYKPDWRNYASGAVATVTHGEARTYALSCRDLMLAWPNYDKDKFKDLVTCLFNFEADQKKQVVEAVRQWLETKPNENDILDLREYVRTRTITSRGRKRAIKKDYYADGKAIYELLEPDNVLLKHRWLFMNTWIDYTPEELDEDEFDHDAREQAIKNERKNALTEIFAALGSHGLFDLILSSKSGYIIGQYIYNDILKIDAVPEFIIECLIRSSNHIPEFENCIAGLLCQVAEGDHDVLISKALDSIPPDNDDVTIRARLFMCALFGEQTWNQLLKQDAAVHEYYWSHVGAGWGNLSDGEINHAISLFLDAKRPYTAFGFSRLKLKSVASHLIIDLLKKVAEGPQELVNCYKPNQHDIEKALEILGSRDDFDPSDLVSLEYQYVGILHSHSRYGIPNLAKEVAQSPIFFTQLTALCFRRNDDGSDPDEWNFPQEKEKQKDAAMNAHHVLDALNVIPGTEKDGTINVEKLRDWITQVRKLAAEYSRPEITDQMIGKLLSTSRPGNDGIWPREEIRQILDEIASTDIARGMETAKYNAAGAEWRSDDSSKELAKATDYQCMSDQIINKHPFTGSMLANMAKKYERDAEWWDTDRRVNRRLRGW